MRLERPLVRRDKIAPDPHLDAIKSENDIDFSLDKPIRNAISDCIDINKTIDAHVPFQPPRADRQRTVGERPQCFLLAFEPDDRLFERRSMDSLIGDLDDPRSEMVLERRERREGSARERVVLHVSDGPFDLPLGAGAARFARLGDDASIATEDRETGVKHDFAGRDIVRLDERRRVVAKDLLGHAAEPAKGVVDPLEPVVLPFGEKRLAIAATRESEDATHEMNNDVLIVNQHAFLTEIDLQLFAGSGLEAVCGEEFGLFILSQGSDGALDGTEIDSHALACEFLLHDDRVSLSDGLVKGMDRLKPSVVETPRFEPNLATRLASREITANGVARDKQLFGDPFNPGAAL